MAINSRKPNSGKNKPAQDRAPAWINLSIIGKNGKPINVGGIPLSLDKAVHAEIMNRGQDLLDAVLENGKVTLTLQIVEQHEEGETFFD